MADFTSALLDLPARTASAAVALAYLDDAAAAVARLSDDADSEALHDFRVAIRRLRVTLRGYPDTDASLSKKHRSKLRKLARHTNPAREAEVQIAWLRERRERFTPVQRAALSRFRARLRAQRRRRLASTQRKLQRWFSKLERKLRRRLSTVTPREGKREPPFRVVAAAAVVDQAHALTSRLQETLTKTNAADLHATRIAAKRLRYLLEPLVPGVRGADAVVERLKVLQGDLGAVTDAHELETALREVGGATAAAVTLVRGEAETVLATLRQQWPQAAPDVARQIEAIAHQLRPREPATTPPSMRQRSRHRRRKATA